MAENSNIEMTKWGIGGRMMTEADKWQPMETAPLNPYGKPWGPAILIWDAATKTPVSVYFDPWFGYKDRDCGPGWVVNDGIGDSVVAPEDALGWMPIAAPWSEGGAG